MSVLPFDEIHALVGQSYKDAVKSGEGTHRICDDLLAILIAAYRLGVAKTAESLHATIEDEIDELYEIAFCRIGGITFEERVRRHVDAGDENGLLTLAESEAHRVFETAAYRAAKRAQDRYGMLVGKRWDTMRDIRVRETHEYLEGRLVPLGEEFYTFDGDHAQYPGGFEKAENNVNCRCSIGYARMDISGVTPVIGQGSP